MPLPLVSFTTQKVSPLPHMPRGSELLLCRSKPVTRFGGPETAAPLISIRWDSAAVSQLPPWRKWRVSAMDQPVAGVPSSLPLAVRSNHMLPPTEVSVRVRTTKYVVFGERVEQPDAS